MARVLVLNGPNHGFDKSAPLVHEALKAGGHATTLSEDKGMLASGLDEYDVVVLGTGFTRRGPAGPDGKRPLFHELDDKQSEGLFSFVRGGKGFVGIHGTAWWIGGEPVKLTGGAANWHPAGLEFTVKVDQKEHAIFKGVSDFTVQDEIYISSWDPEVEVLASAAWQGRDWPMAWTHQYGQGKVFFTTLGHGSNTFEVPEVQRMLANAAGWVAG